MHDRFLLGGLFQFSENLGVYVVPLLALIWVSTLLYWVGQKLSSLPGKISRPGTDTGRKCPPAAGIGAMMTGGLLSSLSRPFLLRVESHTIRNPFSRRCAES